MTTTRYLEQVLNSMESLPEDIRRNLVLLGEMDEKNEKTLFDVDVSSDEYLKKVENFNKFEKTRVRNDMREKLDNAKTIADEQVSIAFQTYELVDKHIVHLDAVLANLDKDITERASTLLENEKNSSSCVADKEIDENCNTTNKKKKLKRKEKLSPSPTYNSKIKSKKVKGMKKKNKVNEREESKEEESSDEQSNLTELLDECRNDILHMPIDPNEPTYCFCKQVSYGNMIGCDNPSCIIEWFHYPCVEITKKPKGDWFCPNCKKSNSSEKLNLSFQ